MNEFQYKTVKYWENLGWNHDLEDDYEDVVVLSKSKWLTEESMVINYVLVFPNYIKRIGKTCDSG